MTKKQKQLLDYLEWYIEAEGIAPTLKEAAQHFNITKGAISSRLEGLAREGRIKVTRYKQRGIKVIKEKNE